MSQVLRHVVEIKGSAPPVELGASLSSMRHSLQHLLPRLPRLRWQPRPIGLEWGLEQLRLVQFGGPGPSPCLTAAATVPYPGSREALWAEPKLLRPWLTDVLSQYGFRGQQVVSALPAESVRMFPVSLDAAEPDMARAVVHAVSLRLPGDMGHSVMDYVPIRNGLQDGPREALVAVARRDDVLNHLAHLESAGLTPEALEVGPVALARLTSHINTRAGADRYPHALLINFGRLRSHVSVIWGRRLVLDREISFSESVLLQRMTRSLELDEDTAQRMLLKMGMVEDPANDDEFAQALVEVLRPELALLVSEINRTLVYTASRSRGQGIDQVYLVGSISRYPGIEQLLAKRLALPVSVMDPLAGFDSSLSAAQLGALEPVSSVAVATGLALRGWASHA